MIPRPRRPDQAVLDCVQSVRAAIASVSGRPSLVWHAALGLAIGWPAAAPETHAGLAELVDARGEACELVDATTTWISDGAGCSLSTAHRLRRDVAHALGVDLVAAAGLDLLCDPRTVLARVPAGLRDALRLACREAAASGRLPQPLLDQVPLGAPYRTPRWKRGKGRCPLCSARAMVLRVLPTGHQTTTCHACHAGGTKVGDTVRFWLVQRGPSANGRPAPGLVKRPTQRMGRPRRYPWDPSLDRNNDPRDPTERAWVVTGVAASAVVRRLGGVAGPAGAPWVSRWDRVGRTVIHAAGATVVVRSFDGAIRLHHGATAEQWLAVWMLVDGAIPAAGGAG